MRENMDTFSKSSNLLDLSCANLFSVSFLIGRVTRYCDVWYAIRWLYRVDEDDAWWCDKIHGYCRWRGRDMCIQNVGKWWFKPSFKPSKQMGGVVNKSSEFLIEDCVLDSYCRLLSTFFPPFISCSFSVNFLLSSFHFLLFLFVQKRWRKLMGSKRIKKRTSLEIRPPRSWTTLLFTTPLTILY